MEHLHKQPFVLDQGRAGVFNQLQLSCQCFNGVESTIWSSYTRMPMVAIKSTDRTNTNRNIRCVPRWSDCCVTFSISLHHTHTHTRFQHDSHQFICFYTVTALVATCNTLKLLPTSGDYPSPNHISLCSFFFLLHPPLFTLCFDVRLFTTGSLAFAFI